MSGDNVSDYTMTLEDASLVRWVNGLNSGADPLRSLSAWYRARAQHAQDNTVLSARGVEHLNRIATRLFSIAAAVDMLPREVGLTVVADLLRYNAPRGGAIRKEINADHQHAAEEV